MDWSVSPVDVLWKDVQLSLTRPQRVDRLGALAGACIRVAEPHLALHFLLRQADTLAQARDRIGLEDNLTYSSRVAALFVNHSPAKAHQSSLDRIHFAFIAHQYGFEALRRRFLTSAITVTGSYESEYCRNWQGALFAVENAWAREIENALTHYPDVLPDFSRIERSLRASQPQVNALLPDSLYSETVNQPDVLDYRELLTHMDLRQPQGPQ